MKSRTLRRHSVAAVDHRLDLIFIPTFCNQFRFFDAETTGLPESWSAPVQKLDNCPRMVQLAWSLRDEQGAVLQECVQIIKPEGFAIPKEASQVHGITTEKRIARANY